MIQTVGSSELEGGVPAKNPISSETLKKRRNGTYGQSSLISALQEELAAAKAELEKKDRALAENRCHNSLCELQEWLVSDGARSEGVKSTMHEYCTKLSKDWDSHVDRFMIGDVVQDPQMNCCVWAWHSESGDDKQEHHLASDMTPLAGSDQKYMGTMNEAVFSKAAYEENLRSMKADEPFKVLAEGRANRVVMKKGDDECPCEWFTKGGFTEYLALPMFHRGVFRGCVAWSTKSTGGFTPSQIRFFESSVPCLAMVVRAQCYEANMETVMKRLEDEVEKRTAELKLANDKLAEANDKIQSQSKAQKLHFAMMSHELRTPLNCVVGMSQLIVDSEELPNEHRESMELVCEAADLLGRIVNDVLDYSKLVSGNLEFLIEPTDLVKTMRTVSSSMASKASANDVTIRTFYKDLPQIVMTDGRRLSQVLYNLLGNAIKFGARGEFVDFSVSCVDGDDDTTNTGGNGRRLRFEIRDYGRGIKEKDIETVFQPFQQVGHDTERLFGGTGLGLTITSKLVDALDGTIGVTSEPSEWCLFTVEIPLQIVSSSPEIAISSSLVSSGCDSHQPDTPKMQNCVSRKAKAAPPVNFCSVRVLIAEDSKVNQKVLTKSLKRLGVVHIDVANNGDEAVNLTAEKQFDLILMDLQMPVMDGLEATEIITNRKREDGQANPKIYALTAHALDEYREKVKQAGGDGFIPKPFKLNRLKEVLSSVMTQLPDDAVDS